MTETPTETRERILDEYGWCAEHDLSYRPGKFESEPIFAPYFYEQSMEGFGDPMYEDCEHESECECEDSWIGDVIDITDEDREVWPELDSEARFVTVFVSDQGFAYVTTHEADPRMVTA